MPGPTSGFRKGKYQSAYDAPPPRYDGPTWIGKQITPPPFGVGPQWVGKRIHIRDTHGQADSIRPSRHPAR